MMNVILFKFEVNHEVMRLCPPFHHEGDLLLSRHGRVDLNRVEMVAETVCLLSVRVGKFGAVI